MNQARPLTTYLTPRNRNQNLLKSNLTTPEATPYNSQGKSRSEALQFYERRQ